jgi:poly(hydroxyalkanoate) granule-associated protein
MAKLVKRNAARRGARVLRKSAHDIWLAGLGALTLAEEEGGKLFRTLVKRGAALEAKNVERLERLLAKAKPMGEDAVVALREMGSDLGSRLERRRVPARKRTPRKPPAS